MNELKIFENQEFGKIRSVMVNNEPYFVGKDICTIFGDTNHKRSLARLDEDEKVIVPVETNGGIQSMTVINESGLYSLLFNMQPEKAKGVSQNDPRIEERIKMLKDFKRWVTHEVIPAIRKTGGYIAGEESMTEDELVLKAINVLQIKVENYRLQNQKLLEDNNKKEQIIGELKPKADYVDTILQNKGLVTITAIAKDYGMSGEKMNEKLHNLGIQYKQSNQWLLYSKYHDNGYTHSETISLKHKDGTPFVKMLTKWTQKGRLFLYELLKSNGLVPVVER